MEAPSSGKSMFIFYGHRFTPFEKFLETQLLIHIHKIPNMAQLTY
jgi:hypothetical protein